MITDYLFWRIRTSTLEENATITYVKGICLDNLEGIY